MSTDPKSNAYEVLELIQKRYLELKGLKYPPDLDKKKMEYVIKATMGEVDVSQMYSKVKEKFNGLVLKTKYQDLYTYEILNDIIQNIEEIKRDIFKDMNLNIKMPCFGSVDYGVFSAEIFAPNYDEKLIIISNGLFIFAHLISKIIVQLLPIEEVGDGLNFLTDIDKISKQIENNIDIKLRFYDLMLACLLTKEPPRAKQYFVDSKLNHMVSIIETSFETFVVSHEYSHSILGHLENKNIHSTSEIEELKNSELEAIRHSWEEEIEADLYGARITLEVMNKKGYDLYVSMLGIIVCMNSLELFDKIEMLHSGNASKRKISRSHPPGSVRELLIEQQYFKDKNIDLFQTFDKVFSNLWEDFVIFFNKLNTSIENKIKMNVYEIPFEVAQSIMYHVIVDENQQT